MRSQFSTHISALVTLNNSLLDKVKDLEAEVEERKRRHESTKQLLVSSMGKRTALNEELLKLKEKNKEKEKEGYRPGDHNQNVTDLEREVEKYKDRVQVLLDHGKSKEKEWSKAIKGYKEFKSSCTCQDTSKAPPLPSAKDTSKAPPSPSCARSTPVSSIQSKKCSETKPSKTSTSSSNPSKRLRRLSPVGSQKIRYAECTPPKPNVTVYADDSQDSPEIENLLKQTRLEHSFANAPTLKLRKSDPPPLSPNEECQSPVILQEDWSEMFGSVTPVVTKQPRKFNILNEFKGDVSISEEKLGFSLDSTCPPEEQAGVKKDFTKSKVEKDVSTSKEQRTSTTHTTTAPTTSKDFKFEAVVRKKEDRLKMKGSDCPLCVRYYEACGLPPEEIKRLIGDVTRHRHMHDKGGDTPPGYWDMTLPDGMATQPATQRKPRKKNKYLRKGL